LPLQPKHFKSKRRQKGRKLVQFNYKNTLRFGDCGLMLPRPLLFTASTLLKTKAFLKKASKKGDKTHRKM
jgi:hypothetical protein